jgi:hypothetical protein
LAAFPSHRGGVRCDGQSHPVRMVIEPWT